MSTTHPLTRYFKKFLLVQNFGSLTSKFILGFKIWDVTDLPSLKESRPEIPKRVLKRVQGQRFDDSSSSEVVDSQLSSSIDKASDFFYKSSVFAEGAVMKVDAEQYPCRVDFKYYSVWAHRTVCQNSLIKLAYVFPP